MESKLLELDPHGRFQPSQADLALIKSIYPVSRETIDRLTLYNALLHRWQAKTNLVAPNTLAQYWSRHVADSLQLIPLISKLNDGSDFEGINWVDIGSGGGFPGLVVAIMMAETNCAPDKAGITLIESIQKKCSFLRRVSGEAGLNDERKVVSIACVRIESATEQLEAADIITARALASLEKLLEMTFVALDGRREKGSRAFFHKGRDYAREIEESRGKWNFDLLVHPSVIDAESVILEVSNVSRLK